MIKSVLPQLQGTVIGYLGRVHGVTLRGKVCSCEICEALNVEPFSTEQKNPTCDGSGHLT